jgi:cell division protein ZapA (FtsZ GTPase activity inhibitor)
MSTLKKCKISVFGESYTLVSDEPEEHIIVAAQSVDDLMRSIAEKSGISDTKRIAVLAALQLASNIKGLEAVIEHRTQKERQLISSLDRELSSSLL